ncbi:suppressor of fused domain protein [Pseudomarimonas salicorniae]|uniref:Suppressor of fused domain protein n=1 Tax=Pseudomarimonas salicorniae TaxID=2933270 RepID=A0ABT0GM43_9GAMM|nr:suppressor of fused domain protein [Lysobacter sp. CAU 1642]MCK7595610.1 suppressor of fused domain protein [Lysobacter sp. CAU 1642]
MHADEYKKRFEPESSPGWDAIDLCLRERYGEQTPKHFANPVPFALGGENPLQGVSIYDYPAEPAHLHFVTYGLSELFYNEEAAGGEFSGFGFELTLRLEKPTSEGEVPYWAMNLLQNIAKYVFSSKRWFEPGHFMPANGPICLGSSTLVTALVMVEDPELGTISTPHGQLQFVQAFGVTQQEYEAIRDGKLDCSGFIEHEKQTNPLFITRLGRAES